jgi:hypothetical protein
MPRVLVEQVITCCCCDPWTGLSTTAGQSKSAKKKARKNERDRQRTIEHAEKDEKNKKK